MSDKTDQAKGRVKEAAGDLTGNRELKSEGTADRLAGELKEKLNEARGKVDETIDKAKESLHRHD